MFGSIILGSAVAQTQESEKSINTASELAKLVNEYGFMLVFSTIILIIIVVIVFSYIKRTSRKTDAEMRLFEQERQASIQQNKQMFDLVTNIQVKQIVQLEAMTSSLQQMNSKLQQNVDALEQVSTNIEKIERNISKYDDSHAYIRQTLDEVLTYIKANNTISNEIADKVRLLEITLNQLDVMISNQSAEGDSNDDD